MVPGQTVTDAMAKAGGIRLVAMETPRMETPRRRHLAVMGLRPTETEARPHPDIRSFPPNPKSKTQRKRVRVPRDTGARLFRSYPRTETLSGLGAVLIVFPSDSMNEIATLRSQ